MPRKLLNLARDNQGRGAPLRAQASEDGQSTDLFIYDVIDGFWGISALAFAQQLAAVTTPNVRLRINSPGGDVFEARAMMAAISEHPATFTARIDGLCASAATEITLPCDSVEIVDGGFYMIHNAWTMALGNASDMREIAAMLDKVDGSLVDGYVARSGKPADEVRTLMAAETWFEAQAAIDAGFCDSLVEIRIGGRASAAAFNLKAYANAPKIEEPVQAEADQAARERQMARLRLYELTN
jgi:ATP-dependent protease ClpP protease subunit